MMIPKYSPTIPGAIKENLTYSYDSAGGWDPDTGDPVPAVDASGLFTAAILPLSEKDLKYAREGRYSEATHKIYVDDLSLELPNGARVTRPSNGEVYQVYGVREYETFTPFKRYFVKRLGGATADV